jgi:diguanylate cyclase (GGDEF)-like protein/PAS domain S-box-containing protein
LIERGRGGRGPGCRRWPTVAVGPSGGVEGLRIVSAMQLVQTAVDDAVFSRSAALMVLIDPDHRIVLANDAAHEVLGAMSLIGQDVTRLLAAREVPAFRRVLRAALRDDTPASQECELLARSGGGDAPRRFVAWSITPLVGEPRRAICVGVDVTAARQQMEALRSRAVTDDLTGLPNRTGLLAHLREMAGSGASVVFCDLDRFKAVNDNLGHAAGDAVLVQAANRLKRAVRGEDFVARLGGDEFVIVVPPEPQTDVAGLARRLLRAIEQPMILPGGFAATVGMSIGESVLAPGADPVQVLDAADRDMYMMKSRLPTRTSRDPA